jgi:folate-binding Fe-S cluster repair protein YgfZ
MPQTHLQDRGVVRIAGPDAKAFLDGLVTCDLDRVAPQTPRLGALLTPQGKILFDFIVFAMPEEAGGGYALDVLKGYAPDLARRLGFYRLRAKVEVEDRSGVLAVAAGWGDTAPPDDEVGVVAADPRLPALGWRAIVAATMPRSSRACRPTPTMPTASPSACPRAGATSSSATPSRTRP